jgi:hypothetical protein
MRACSACVLLLGALVATAAPVPKEREKEQKEREKVERVFGPIEDPDRDCQFVLDGEKLKLTMKGGKQYDYDDKLKNCPRAVREVKGDFVVTVRASAVLPENAAPAKGDMAEAGAGLFVLGPKGEAWRSGVHDFLGEQRHRALILPGTHGPAGLEMKAEQGIFTRFSRKGDSLVQSISGDGKKWISIVTLSELKLGESLRVGIYGFANAKDDTTVYLDKFSIELPKEAKR